MPGQPMSDLALTMYLHTCYELVREVGVQRFQVGVRRALMECEFRPTIAKLRKLCGYETEHEKELAEQWDAITAIVDNGFLATDEQGATIVKAKTSVANGTMVLHPAPQLTDKTKQIVRKMGGWEAVSGAFPQFWGQQYKRFTEMWG
jgi:hypothetical protein